MAVILNTQVTLDPNNQLAHLADLTDLVPATQYVITGTYLQADTRFLFQGNLDITLTKPPVGVPAPATMVNCTVSTVPVPAPPPPPAKYPYGVKDRLLAANLNLDFENAPGAAPPNTANGAARLGRFWLDTSAAPPQLRLCAVAQASPGYVAAEWYDFGSIAGGGTATPDLTPYMPLAGDSTKTGNLTVTGGVTAGSSIVNGTSLAKGVVTINTNAAAPPAALTGTLLEVSAADGQGARITLDTYGVNVGPNFTFRTARGTRAVPTASQVNDTLGLIAAFGYGATGYPTSNRGSIAFGANENWTDTAQGTRFWLATTPIGATAPVNSLVITDALLVGSGDAQFRTLQLTGNTIHFNNTALPQMSADASNMTWQLGTGNVAWTWFNNGGGVAMSLTAAGALSIGSLTTGNAHFTNSVTIDNQLLVYNAATFQYPVQINNTLVVGNYATFSYPVTVNNTLTVNNDINVGGGHNISSGNDIYVPGLVRGGPGDSGRLKCYSSSDWVMFAYSATPLGTAYINFDNAWERALPTTQNATQFNIVSGGGPTALQLNFNDFNGNLYASYIDATSDARVKENIADSEIDALALLCRVPVRQFDFRAEVMAHYSQFGGAEDRSPHVAIGLVAQELEALIPEAVAVLEQTADALPSDMRFISHDQIIPYLVRAVQQLASQVAALKLR